MPNHKNFLSLFSQANQFLCQAHVQAEGLLKENMQILQERFLCHFIMQVGMHTNMDSIQLFFIQAFIQAGISSDIL